MVWESNPNLKRHCGTFFDGFILCIPYTFVTTSEKNGCPFKATCREHPGCCSSFGNLILQLHCCLMVFACVHCCYSCHCSLTTSFFFLITTCKQSKCLAKILQSLLQQLHPHLVQRSSFSVECSLSFNKR